MKNSSALVIQKTRKVRHTGDGFIIKRAKHEEAASQKYDGADSKNDGNGGALPFGLWLVRG